MRRTHRFTIALSCAAIALALPGCAKKATGQVAAVVNGDEITIQEVNAELALAGIPDGAEKDKARAEITQRLIDKRLLEQQAKAAGVDRDPDFLLRQRQMNQALLIEAYAKRAQDTLRVPDQAAVAKFIAEHPASFADRVIYTVDQLRSPPITDAAVLAGLNDLRSLDAVAAYMNSKGIETTRGPAKIDSAQVPADLLARVAALPPGEPFIVPTPQGVVSSVITGREAAPLPPNQAQPLAVQMMRNQQLEDVMKQRLTEARGKAEISYQPGFAPAAAPKS